MMRRLEHLFSKDRLRKLGLFSLDKRMHWEDLIEAFQYQMGPTKKLKKDFLQGTRGALAPARWRKETIGPIGLWGSDGLTRDPQEYKALVDTTAQCAMINTAKCIFLHSFSNKMQATVCFHMERHPVHLELITPGVEPQPHYLPWTNPDCTGKKGEAPEHLQYSDDIIAWSNTAEEVFEKGEKIIQFLLKASFAIKQSKVKGPAQEIQVLGVKWQDGHCQIPMDMVNKIAAVSPTSKTETQAFLGTVGFWRMPIPDYKQIAHPIM
ncbi:hypothetical protein TURU_010605 [Turdus rufiventris]|nr:hypothetical protein TURU_010605 [Turdus rufiventris]